MIKIIVDSGCDISQEKAKKLGIKVLPLEVAFGEERYLDGVTLTGEAFYEKLGASSLSPKTSQINAYAYGQAFEEEFGQGNEVLCITLSSKLSGCYQSANLAKSSASMPVEVVDSLNVSLGEASLVYAALSYIDKGLDLKTVAEKLRALTGRVKVFALLDTLEFLRRSGRISKAVAFLGEALGFKPIVTVKEGAVCLAGKSLGRKSAPIVLKRLIEKCGGPDEESPVLAAFGGTPKEDFSLFLKQIGLKILNKENSSYQIGAAIGSHVGPGAMEIAFLTKGD